MTISDTTTKAWTVGTEITGPTRWMSYDRIVWYEDGLFSSATGHSGPKRLNIHTDDDFAKKNGLPGAVADGMLSTNWIQNLLLTEFGTPFVYNGYLRTKYIKPTYLDVWITTHGRVTSVEETSDGVVVSLEVWTDDPEGTLLTVGEARVTVPRA